MSGTNLIKNFIAEYSAGNKKIFPYLVNSRKEFNADTDSVYYSGPYWNELEIQAAVESLMSGMWLSSGEKVDKFERRFSKLFGFHESLMVNSGSSACPNFFN
jgi:CDP-6-deoxy-D-xylo-4-hexulose-3-dehydrase